MVRAGAHRRRGHRGGCVGLTVDALRRIDAEFGLLTSAEVGRRMGSRSSAPRNLAASARRGGALVAVNRGHRTLYPGFQFGADGRPLPVIRRLRELAEQCGWSETSVVQWLCAPTTYLNGLRPVEQLDTGERLYRVFTAAEGRSAVTFSPGYGAPTWFAFFGDPAVPVLYAAATQEASVAETLLHDIPADSGVLPYDAYARTVTTRLTVTRPIRLGVLHGPGLPKLRHRHRSALADRPLRAATRRCPARRLN